MIDIKGKDHIEGVTLAQVDENKDHIPGTQEAYRCDTLLLSVGLIPENELTRGLGARMDEKTHGPVVDERLQTTVAGVFACGNVLHVHDLADHVSQEAAEAGKHAADYVKEAI